MAKQLRFCGECGKPLYLGHCANEGCIEHVPEMLPKTPPPSRMIINTGGLLRCCVNTAEDAVDENRVKEGDSFQCLYCHEPMRVREGVVEWAPKSSEEKEPADAKMPKYIVHTKFKGLFIKREIGKLVTAGSPEEAKEKVLAMYRAACEEGRAQAVQEIGEIAGTFAMPQLEIVGVEEMQEEEERWL